MKKLFHNYQQLSICKRKLDAMNLVHALCTFLATFLLKIILLGEFFFKFLLDDFLMEKNLTFFPQKQTKKFYFPI